MRKTIDRDPSRIPALDIPDRRVAEFAPRQAPASKAPIARRAAAAQQSAPVVKPAVDELKPFISEAPVAPKAAIPFTTRQNLFGAAILSGATACVDPYAGLLVFGAGVASALNVFGRVGRLVENGIDRLTKLKFSRAKNEPEVERKEPTIARGDEVPSKNIRRGTAGDVRNEPVVAPVSASASGSEPELHLPASGEVPFALELAIRQAALGEVKPRERKRKAAGAEVKPEPQIAPEVEAQLHADISAVLADVDAERKAKRAAATPSEAPAPTVVRRADKPAAFKVRRVD